MSYNKHKGQRKHACQFIMLDNEYDNDEHGNTVITYSCMCMICGRVKITGKSTIYNASKEKKTGLDRMKKRVVEE